MEKKEQQRVEIRLQLLKEIIWGRYNIVFSTSILATSILVIGTFSKELIPLSIYKTKILMIVLLILIPISLFDYTFKLWTDSRTIMQKINPNWKNPRNLYEKIWDASPFIYIFVISAVIVFIVITILQSL